MRGTWIVLALILVALACEKDPDVQKEITVSLSLGESITVFDTYEVRTDSLADSRCPTGVECVWEGEVSVSLLVRESDIVDVMELCIGNQDSCQDTDNFSTLQVTLDRVDPYPDATSETRTEDYRVHLTIKRP